MVGGYLSLLYTDCKRLFYNPADGVTSASS